MSERQYGQYRIKEIIGQGGMATVYRAEQESIGRDVALKVLPQAYASDPGFLRRFRREVHVIAQIEHPSIIPVYDYGEAEGQPFIVMRLLEGGTLEDRMMVEIVSSTLTLHIIRQIAEALDHAHRVGVIHRDVKPSNILLDDAGNGYLTDFGIARLIGETTRITRDGVMGTPTYMSPEQCQAKDLTPSSDLYSLGIIAYELLCGAPPFDSEKPLSIMYMHVRDAIPSIYDFDPELPEGLDDLFATALHKDPTRRFTTAGEFAGQLERLLRGWARAPRRITPREHHTGKRQPVREKARQQANDLSQIGYRVNDPATRRRGNLASIIALSFLGVAIIAGIISAVLPHPQDQDLPAADMLDSTLTAQAIIAPSPQATLAESEAPEPVISIYIPGKLAYVQGFGDEAEVIISSADGTSTRQLTTNSYLDGEPDWSPDGTRIVYESAESGNRDIVIMELASGVITPVTASPVSESNPDWSPDGGSITFEASDGSDLEIFVIGADGEGLRQITDNETDDRAPQYSPDGRWIAYMTRQEAGWVIALYSLRESVASPPPFSCPGIGCRFPSWSPDSRYLAFNTIDEEDQAAEIWAVDITDGSLIPLIQGGANGRPVWAAGGDFLFFNRDVDGQPAIYWFNTRSGEIGRFTGSGPAYYAPDWVNTGS